MSSARLLCFPRSPTIRLRDQFSLDNAMPSFLTVFFDGVWTNEITASSVPWFSFCSLWRRMTISLFGLFGWLARAAVLQERATSSFEHQSCETFARSSDQCASFPDACVHRDTRFAFAGENWREQNSLSFKWRILKLARPPRTRLRANVLFG